MCSSPMCCVIVSFILMRKVSTRFFEQHLGFFPSHRHTLSYTEVENALERARHARVAQLFFHGDGEAVPRGLMWEPSGDRAGLTDPRRMGQLDQRRGCFTVGHVRVAD